MKFNIYNRRYTGSKTKLNDWIESLIEKHCHDYSSLADIFAGTGAVAAHNIHKFNKLILNDILFSNQIIYSAFFSKGRYNKSKLINFEKIFQEINAKNVKKNYFSNNFGNKFFNKDDALIIGNIRELIEENKKDLNNKEYDILITSLLYSADKAANTVGHYDAYRKINNIKRKFDFKLIEPISHECEVKIYREDANDLVKKISADIVYIDPPYNSRQYSRFYHVLENLTKWEKPKLHGVALKPEPENMSDYCRNAAFEKFNNLISNIDAKKIIVSYNNTYKSKSSSSRNKITLEQISSTLKNKGTTHVYTKSHAHFNAGKTDFSDHKEYLFITEVIK